MNRITIKVHTNKGEKLVRESIKGRDVKSTPMGGGWWHVAFDWPHHGAHAIAALREAFPALRFSNWVYTQAITVPCVICEKPREHPSEPGHYCDACTTNASHGQLYQALRGLMEYVGGWDEKPEHPCGKAAAVLAEVAARLELEGKRQY